MLIHSLRRHARRLADHGVIRYPIMAIYGYEASDVDATQRSRLSEVTFQCSSDSLRQIAKFLLTRADEIDAGNLIDGGRHLRDLDLRWQAEHLGEDVIVVPISPGTPKVG